MTDEETNTLLDMLVCPRCDHTLNLHQPDVEKTEWLLGTCDACHAWFTVDVEDEDNAIITTLIQGREPITK